MHVQSGSDAEPKKKPAAKPAPAPKPAAKAEPAPEPKPEPKKEQPPKKSTATVKGDSIHIPGNIVFDFDKATLKAGAGSEEVLVQLKAYMDENSKMTKVRVEGHTDNQGTPEHNLKLSGDRALTIKKWLVDHGAKEDQVIAVGFGEKKPIAPNANEEGRAQNRRTEFKIAEVNGKPYLGMDATGGGTVFK